MRRACWAPSSSSVSSALSGGSLEPQRTLALAPAEPNFDVDPSPLDRAHERLLAGLRHGEAADWLSARYRARSDLLVFDPARDYIAVCRHPGCHRYADNSLCSAHREQAAVEIALESGLTEELWIARLAPAAPQAEYEQRVPARSRGRW